MYYGLQQTLTDAVLDSFATDDDCFSFDSNSIDQQWAKMELSAFSASNKTKSAISKFRPLALFADNSTDNRRKKTIPTGEPMLVDIPLVNYLQIPIFLRKVTLEFEADAEGVASDVLDEIRLGKHKQLPGMPGKLSAAYTRICFGPTLGNSRILRLAKISDFLFTY